MSARERIGVPRSPRQPKQPKQPARCDLKLAVALIISMPHKQPKQSKQPKQPERGDKKTISRTECFYATQGAQSPGRKLTQRMIRSKVVGR